MLSRQEMIEEIMKATEGWFNWIDLERLSTDVLIKCHIRYVVFSEALP